MRPNSLSRTSSLASISSDDAGRRTRKRFTSVQLMMLEQLFHRSSHPTREEREALAQAAGMEMKSVTIWFQNKRQTERKVALHHTTHHLNAEAHRLAPLPERGSSSSHISSSGPSSHVCRTSHSHSRSISMSSLHTPHRKVTPPRPRPSLDRVAARSESRLPPPRTPTKPRDPYASPWDNMPSSPLAPPASPPAHDFVDFVGSGRSLEWACAAARLAEKEARTRIFPKRTPENRISGDADDETEDDDIEVVTPEGSLGSGDIVWKGGRQLNMSLENSGKPPPKSPDFRPLESERDTGVQDDDMMHAALALCGLGRRM
ncbi:hypothetical protein ID866_12235 [Astraeus odoratus]|nr:hypothetical protein ID866_12235 [Astraeus odoratus]